MRDPLRSAVGPIVVGLVSFFLVVGVRVLDPTNIGWLVSGDPLTHYLGWAFFRQGPWGFPLGANPSYGLDLGSGILYSDSIPLLALAFKPVSPALPEPFQYFGLWLLVCFVLQSWFGWRIAGLGTRDPILRLEVGALLVFSPPMLFRLIGHWALVGHWTLLAGVLLTLAPPRRAAGAWAGLLVLAALIHMYLLAMLSVVWLASLASRTVASPDGRWRALAREGALVTAAVALALWQAGFFLVGPGKFAGGFGLYRMNLTAPVNPAGWSYLLPDLGWRAGEYEGFNYFGLGGLALLAAAVPAMRRLRHTGRLSWRPAWFPIAAALMLLTVFSCTNEAALGRLEFGYPVPEALLSIANIARVSGRMFWPVFYFGLAGAALAVIRALEPLHARVLLAAVLVLQVADTSAGWLPYRRPLQEVASSWRTNLVGGFWYDASSVYSKLRVIPPRNQPEHWSQLAAFAAKHGMATDAVYLARIDTQRLQARLAEVERLLETATFQPDTLYILQGGTARRVQCRLDPGKDLLVLVDGFWALAPGWKQAGGERFSGLPGLPCPSMESRTLGFESGGSGLPLLGTGWARPEDWGTWNEGAQSALNLHVTSGAATLELEVDAFVPPGSAPLDVLVAVDGSAVDSWRFIAGQAPGWRQIPIPDLGTGPRRIVVTFRYSVVRAPSDWRLSPDTRRLALALRQARVVPRRPS